MSLSCVCLDYDGDDGWYWYSPTDFTKLPGCRRKRCRSCNELIEFRADCLEFKRSRPPRDELEEDIMGDEICIASWYMCEQCGEQYLNLSDLGYCLSLGDNMMDNLKEYHKLTGFVPEK